MGAKKSPRIRNRDGPVRPVQKMSNTSNIFPKPFAGSNITARDFMSIESDVKTSPVRLTRNSTLPSPLLPSRVEESITRNLARVDQVNKSSPIARTRTSVDEAVENYMGLSCDQSSSNKVEASPNMEDELMWPWQKRERSTTPNHLR